MPGSRITNLNVADHKQVIELEMEIASTRPPHHWPRRSHNERERIYVTYEGPRPLPEPTVRERGP